MATSLVGPLEDEATIDALRGFLPSEKLEALPTEALAGIEGRPGVIDALTRPRDGMGVGAEH
jgi:hypothetical protein